MLQVSRSAQCRWPCLALVAWLTACGPTAHRPPRTYKQGLDSASNVCIRNPANCPPVLGAQPAPTTAAPIVRHASRPPSPSLSRAQRAALNIGAAAGAIDLAIDATLELPIRKALSQCADEARSTVMLKHFGERGPTLEDCNQVVGVDRKGEPITRAMQLGNEQHEVALLCAQERLEELKPGGFSISPRYRIDPLTGRAQLIPREQVKALLNQGRSAELLGTIEPDIVIHAGNPQQAQLTFDFKFPCVNGGQPPWRRYSAGHPYDGFSQKDVYRALGKRIFRVIPRWGILE
jgi:hypothetical protein